MGAELEDAQPPRPQLRDGSRSRVLMAVRFSIACAAFAAAFSPLVLGAALAGDGGGGVGLPAAGHLLGELCGARALRTVAAATAFSAALLVLVGAGVLAVAWRRLRVLAAALAVSALLLCAGTLPFILLPSRCEPPAVCEPR